MMFCSFCAERLRHLISPTVMHEALLRECADWRNNALEER
jgi:hypothetical protein